MKVAWRQSGMSTASRLGENLPTLIFTLKYLSENHEEMGLLFVIGIDPVQPSGYVCMYLKDKGKR